MKHSLAHLQDLTPTLASTIILDKCSTLRSEFEELHRYVCIYVTGFMKTGPNRTRTEIYFIA